MSSKKPAMILNDDTISLLDGVYEFPEGFLKVGPLRTPIRIKKGAFKKVNELEILSGTESFNAARILLACGALKIFHLGNMDKEGIARIFGQSSSHELIWNSLTVLELEATNPAPTFVNSVETIKYKRFPSLRELKYSCRFPNKNKLNTYIESYMDVHQLIATNRKSLRKVTMNHELVSDVTSPAIAFCSAEAKNTFSTSKKRTNKKLKDDLVSLNLKELRITFSPVESPLEWVKPRGELDIEIIKHMGNLIAADLDWSNTSFYTDKEKDFALFAENNGSTLKRLRVRMTYCPDGAFDCSLLRSCSNLEWLAIESVWCKVKNVQFIPPLVKVLELRVPTKPAQKTWIAHNLTNLEALTIEQSFQDDDPVLPLLRLPELKSFTVVYCTKKRVDELHLFCFNHAGLILYERDDIPFKYYKIANEYQDITITIDHSKYTHQLGFENEETGLKE